MEIDKYWAPLRLGTGMKSAVIPQLLVLLLVFLIAFEAASVHAVTTFVDQQCRTGDGTDLAGIGNYKPVGQTFAPTETDVVIFAVNIYSTNTDNTTMTATILSGGIGGNIIASQSFLIPVGFGLSTKGDWFNVTFDKGVKVTPGQTYAFELSDNVGSTGINWNKCSTSYSAGHGYSLGFPLLNDADFMFMEFSGTFTIEVTPGTLSLAPGVSGSSLVKVTSLGGFDAPVNLTVGSVPAGVTVRLDSNSVTPPADGSTTTTLSIVATVNATAGKYSITISGISGSQHPTSTLTLTVTAPGDFTISANPNTIIVSQGASSACTISVGSINGFNSTVVFTGSWLTPSPVGLSFVPPHPITPSPGTNASSQLLIVGNPDASTGSFNLAIKGTSGSLSHMVNVTVQVQAATILSTTSSRTSSSPATTTNDFSIMLPSTMSLSQGSTAAVQVSVKSIDGFDSSVSLSYSWMVTAPSGVSIDLPGPVTPPPGGAATSTLTVNASPGSSIGTFTLIVTGASGPLNDSANVNIMISASAGSTSGVPQCLIATATYGSELSPEVVILRSFRDNYIQRTKAGSSFMIVFNAWYYSFSPYVAAYLTAHPMSRMLMKGTLYPLVGVLLLTSHLFTISPISEAGILLAGLFASCLIGAIYVGLPLGFVQVKFRLRRKSVGTRLLFATLLTAIAGLIIGEGLAPTMLMISTPLIVVSTMLLSGMTVSSAIATVHGKFSNRKDGSP